MISFAYPYLLFLLLLVPALWLLYVWAVYRRKQKLKIFGKISVLKNLMPEASPYKPAVKISIILAALTLIIIAVCRPWGGIRDEKTTKEGIEVVIAVDASNSMLASANSDPQGISRMRQSKLMLEKLINRLDNDRVGLIVFAGNAYTLIPVTADYVSAKMFLNSIDPTQISNQGTNIASAIDLAEKSFTQKRGIGKALILLTDAEELEDEPAVMGAAKNCAKNGIQLDVIGVGDATGMPVPLPGGGQIIDPDTGEPVRSALNEELAAQIASQGKGIYVNASNKEALNELSKQLDTVKKSALETSFSALHDELFPIFLWIAFGLLILDVLVLNRKISWLDKITFFKKEECK